MPLTVFRLCMETPTAGGRVFEMGDEMLLKFANKIEGASRPLLFLLS
jgi:hypothetical protein